MEGKPVIEINNLSFSYGHTEVLCDINLAIPQGDYIGIIGPNGAGKTTLLKIILGLIKPFHGTVSLFGEDINSFHKWEDIGYVPQKATNFEGSFPATVFEIVLMGRYGKRGLTHSMTAEDKSIVRKALEQVGMLDLQNRLIGELSGGQQQRAFIARALASEPKILFLDEPTVGIDRAAQEEFYTLLRRLNSELGITLVLISHDIETVTREVRHVACIDKALVCHTTPVGFLKTAQSDKVLGHEIKKMSHGNH